MTRICSKCKKSSITYIRYNGTHLCEEHFIKYFHKRVKKDIKKQGKTNNNSRIGIAISGGKDSAVALHIIHKIFSDRKDITFFGISIDEGIKGYRDESIKNAIENCKYLGIEHFKVDFKNLIGFTMDKISEMNKNIGECSYCGVFRRLCLNQKAKHLNINKLVTGHNLDDMAQSILMNFVKGDMKKLARLGPHIKLQPGLVPRILPLRTIPEKETVLYAILKNIKFHDGVCPYAINALRGNFRDIIDNLEYITPGTRHSILNSYNIIKDNLIKKYPPVTLNNCILCGEPTSQELCKSCILKKGLSE
jgi:uncharacterized protein (TIGR00269 family)